jgi:hypothetical protein
MEEVGIVQGVAKCKKDRSRNYGMNLDEEGLCHYGTVEFDLGV